MKVVGERVVVEPKKIDNVTKSGIILAVEDKKSSNEGVVIQIGNVHGIKVGDSIFYKQYGGTEIKIDEKDYIVLNLDDILIVR